MIVTCLTTNEVIGAFKMFFQISGGFCPLCYRLLADLLPLIARSQYIHMDKLVQPRPKMVFTSSLTIIVTMRIIFAYTF